MSVAIDIRATPREQALAGCGAVRVFKTREEWLAFRTDPLVIGASEVASALNVDGAYSRAWDLWERKTQGVQPQHTAPVTQRLTRGNRWEPVVLAEYADASGNQVIVPGELFGTGATDIVNIAHPSHDWLRESPDAFALSPSGELGHVEGKTATRAHAWSPDHGIVIDSWDDRWAELIPPHYAVQCYVQLACSGRPWNDCCALVPHGGWLSIRWVRLMRDVATQDALVHAVAEWREKHLVGGEPPETDGSAACSRYIAKRFPKRGKSLPERMATAEEDARIRAYQTRKIAAKREAVALKAEGNALAMSAAGHRVMLGTEKGAPYGQPQITAGRTTIDSEKLQREFPAAYRACAKTGQPSAAWRVYRLGADDADDE
jgi:predicted phage-related endonuclease